MFGLIYLISTTAVGTARGVLPAAVETMFKLSTVSTAAMRGSNFK